MSGQREVDRILETWLADGPTELSGHAIKNILTQVDETNQRGLIRLPGGIRMNRMIIGLGGVAAAIVLAAVGVTYYIGLGVGIGRDPAPTATPLPTATPVALRLGENVVEAGTYTAELNGHRYTVTVPDTDFGDIFAGWGARLEPNSWGVTWDGEGTVPNFSSIWIYSDTSTLYDTACDWEGSEFTPGPTVDDLATALAGLEDFTTSDPTDVSLAGYQGKRLKVSMPLGINVENCPEALYQSFAGKADSYGSGGQTDDIRVLNIDGVRHLLVTHYQVGTPEEAVAALNAMLDSMLIEPI